MKVNWLATTAIVISLGAGGGVAFAQMPDSPQRHEHGAGGQNPSMSRPEADHSVVGEERHLGERSEHAAQPGMREGAETAHQHDLGSATHEQAADQHQRGEAAQTTGQAGERLGHGEHGSPNAAAEAQENRPGREAHQRPEANREQGKAAEMKPENKAAETANETANETAKSAKAERHGQEPGQGRVGRNDRQKENLTGQNQQPRGSGAEHAEKNQHEQNKQAAQPSRSETSTAQQHEAHPAQTTGQASRHEGTTGQAQTRENTGQSQARDHAGQTQEHAGQAQNESNVRGQTASTKINNQQRTQVVDRLRSDKDLERARSDVDIRVNVGERLPDRVRPRPLPSDIVNIVPEYRGYDYTVIHDEIAIINPDSREVVDVIPERGFTAEGGESYGGSYAESGRIELSQEQREILRRDAFGSATVGSAVSSGPTCLSLRPVPEELARSNPELASDKYLAIGDQVVLVDSHDRKIVQVINY